MGSILTPRTFAWLAAIALVAAGVGVWIGREIAGRDGATFPDPASTTAARIDARVGEEFGKRLTALDHNVHDWDGRFESLVEGAGSPELAKAACVLAPPADATPDDVTALLGWVEAGGTLFVAPVGSPVWETAVARWVALVPEEADAAAIPGDRMVPHESGSWRYRDLTGEERVTFAEPIKDIAVPGPMRVADPTRENSILFPREGLGLVAEIVHGDGNLIVIAEAGLFSDEGLGSASNAAFLASLVEDWVPAGAAVWVQRD